MLKVKVTNVGNSMDILLPQKAFNQMKANKGDTLCLTEGPERYTLKPCQQDFEEQMQAAEDIMKRYKNTLKALAK